MVKHRKISERPFPCKLFPESIFKALLCRMCQLYTVLTRLFPTLHLKRSSNKHQYVELQMGPCSFCGWCCFMLSFSMGCEQHQAHPKALLQRGSPCSCSPTRMLHQSQAPMSLELGLGPLSLALLLLPQHQLPRGVCRHLHPSTHTDTHEDLQML